ncbi:MAG TPA: methyltransferase domain-containing protein [Jatrophihabitans sp.]|nr:methyltransferase domain-containing protein [Jatrophihabitans sp.]
MPAFDAAYWDERYRDKATVWGLAPNRFVEQEVADLRPGRALDLACGEGRNALWLASRGWTVVAVDFSAVAVEKGRAGAAQLDHPERIDWRVADATTFQPDTPVDLALLCYLQVAPQARRAAVSRAASALAPGGELLVVAHDSRNLTDGTGGPQDPRVLYTAADLAGDLAGTDLVIDKAGEVLRPVDGAPRPAIDTLLRAHRPPQPMNAG